jgi:hypothetical protein
MITRTTTSRPRLRHLPHRLAPLRHRGTLRVSLKRAVQEQLFPRLRRTLPIRHQDTLRVLHRRVEPELLLLRPHPILLIRHRRGTVSLKRVEPEQLLPHPHSILPTRLPSAQSSPDFPSLQLQK